MGLLKRLQRVPVVVCDPSVLQGHYLEDTAPYMAAREQGGFL